jgi:hypothetical protein
MTVNRSNIVLEIVVLAAAKGLHVEQSISMTNE